MGEIGSNTGDKGLLTRKEGTVMGRMCWCIGLLW